MADVVNFENGGRFRGMAPYPVPDVDLRALFLPDDFFANGGRFVTAGNDEIVAGRPAAVLDYMEAGRRVGRYWFDRQYGAILRRIDYGGKDFLDMVTDRKVTAIYFDADLPSAIFQTGQYRSVPWRSLRPRSVWCARDPRL
jgi:hypothetical protein